MNYSRYIKRMICIVSILLFICAVSVSAVSAGKFAVVSDGISLKVNETATVPVYILNPDDLVAFQFSIGVCDTDAVKIEVNTASCMKGVAVIDGEVLWTQDPNMGESIKSDCKVFDLFVTPKKTGTITIPITSSRAYEHSSSHPVDYELISGVFEVTGEGNHQIKSDPLGGNNLVGTNSQVDGPITTKAVVGVSEVDIGNNDKSSALIFLNSQGIAQIPSDINYISTDQVLSGTNGGEEYSVVISVPETKLKELGISSSDLYVLHYCMNTETGENMWYTLPISSVRNDNGIVKVTVKAWASGTFVLAYNGNGQNYPQENEKVTHESTKKVGQTVIQSEPVLATPTLVSTPVSSPSETNVPVATTQPASTSQSPMGCGVVVGLLAVAGIISMTTLRRK